MVKQVSEAERSAASCTSLFDTFDDHVTITVVTKGWSYARENYFLDKQWETLETSNRELAPYHSVVERMAFFWILCLGMKWKAGAQMGLLIVVPGFLSNCDVQRSIAHPAIVDYFPWPALRQRLVLNQKLYCTDTFFLPYMKHIRFRWAYERQTAIDVHNETMMTFSSEFTQRLDDLARWSIDSDLLSAFPELAHDCPTYQPSPSASSSCALDITEAPEYDRDIDVWSDFQINPSTGTLPEMVPPLWY